MHCILVVALQNIKNSLFFIWGRLDDVEKYVVLRNYKRYAFFFNGVIKDYFGFGAYFTKSPKTKKLEHYL